MRTLFARFLLWFWAGLAVLICAELLFESHSLEQGLAVRSAGASGPLAMVAGLARTTMLERGYPGLDSLCARLPHEAGLEAFIVDSTGAEEYARALPAAARKAASASLREARSLVVESPGGFFAAYPLARHEGRRFALVLHPLHSAADADGASEREWWSVLPIDLTVRSLVMLVLGGVGCFLLARYITAPVSRLRHATQRLADGDLSARVGYAGTRPRDELEELGGDFDRMAERLDGLLGAQRRLLTDISHELRSPLARMNVAVSLMHSGDPKDVATMLPRLELETQRLNQLIGDVLMLSRAEAGEQAGELQQVDLGALASAVAEDARFEASAQGKEVRFVCDARVEVRGAPELLRSAIDNVVRNAVRFTPAGAAVEIEVRRAAGAGGAHARITVRDHGPGLPAEQLERIFEPFYRFTNAAAASSTGTGLGLAIARRVLDRHAGTIRAEQANGGGLLVTITLPANG